ncbi:MAG: hypothetical protein KGJ43_03080, partial [Acidobacteriota bacterium]|nr:hypothetical protein [Acidobacteriota bacterium]
AAETLPYAPDLAVMDVSFISLAKVLPAVLAALTDRHDVLALVKPQFEVGRELVGKGGVVRSAEHRREALLAVARSALELGESVLGFFAAGIPGPKGNRESFIWLAEGARAGQAGGVGPGRAGGAGDHGAAAGSADSQHRDHVLMEMALSAEPEEGP